MLLWLARHAWPVPCMTLAARVPLNDSHVAWVAHGAHGATSARQQQLPQHIPTCIISTHTQHISQDLQEGQPRPCPAPAQLQQLPRALSLPTCAIHHLLPVLRQRQQQQPVCLSMNWRTCTAYPSLGSQPFSVTMPLISSAGAASKEGFNTWGQGWGFRDYFRV